MKHGRLIFKLLNAVPEINNAHYQTLKRVFEEQYKILNDKKIEISHCKEITAKRMKN